MSTGFSTSFLAICLAGPATLLSCAAAWPADLAAPPAPTAAFDWSGPSIGFSAANLWGATSGSIPNVGKGNGLSSDGPAVGLTLGWDYQLSPALVVGGAADFEFSTANFSASGFGESLKAREYGSWALRGRLGTEIGDGTLVYGTAGASQLIGDATLTGPLNGKSGREQFEGIVFGGGVETAFDDNMFVRFEYLHGAYAGKSFFNNQLKLAPSTDSARLALVLRPDGEGTRRRDIAPIDWSGVYVGALGGWEEGRLTYINSGGSFDGVGAGGFSGAAVVGFNQQADRALIGAEAEISANTAKAQISDTVGDNASLAAPLEAAARVRFGALLTSRTMLYGDIGAAWTRGKFQGNLLGYSLTSGKDYAGLQYGLGFETMLTPHIGARIEYLETRYQKQDFLTPTTAKTQTGLIYKF